MQNKQEATRRRHVVSLCRHRLKGGVEKSRNVQLYRRVSPWGIYLRWQFKSSSRMAPFCVGLQNLGPRKSSLWIIERHFVLKVERNFRTLSFLDEKFEGEAFWLGLWTNDYIQWKNMEDQIVPNELLLWRDHEPIGIEDKIASVGRWLGFGL